jgi:protein TonB
LDETGLPRQRGIVPPLASARIIDLQAARIALGRDGERARPATLGPVPLSFRQWRGELDRRAPRFTREAWAAAAAIHAIIGLAVVLYASLSTLPEPLPGIAVTLSFEPANSGPTSPTTPPETPTTETATTETPPVETPPVEEPPPVPEPPVETAPPEPPQAVPPPEPTPPEPALAEIPLPEPPLAIAPEPPQPVAVTPPPPVPMPPPRPTAKPAPPMKHQAPAQPQAAAPGVSDGPSAASLSTGTPAAAEEPANAPLIPPSPVGNTAGNPKPEYPMAARRGHFEGRLLLRIDVTESGSVSAVAVAASTGHPILDQAGLDAIKGWRFNPATRGGKPVAGVIYWPIEFRLFDEGRPP